MSDFEWGPAEPEQVQLAKPRKCRRHTWVPDGESMAEPVMAPTGELLGYSLPPEAEGRYHCFRCKKPYRPEVSRRGRTNRSRGNAIEREVAKALGLKRTGQFGGPDDASGELFVVQVKSGKSFPERIYRWLKAVPTNAMQTPLVVVTDAPGPGHRRRALVILTLEDWVALHGSGGVEEAA